MRTWHAAVLSILGLAVLACASTKEGKPKDIKFSGFLGDYSQLKPGGPGKVAWAYYAPGFSVSQFNKVMVDPPEAWVSQEQRAKMGEENVSYLLTSLDTAMRDSLGAKWELVDRPAAGVLRIRLAISNATSATGALTPFTRIVPFGLITSLGVNEATGNYLNVGAVNGEMEVVDGGTGKRLAAFVDRREGTGSIGSAFTDWGDVVDACHFWSDRLANRLVELGMRPTKTATP
jgi:hypothetical protein